jgi:outer membrane autotransporter protein
MGGGQVGSFSAGLRASHDFGNFYVAGLAAYGCHSIATSRSIGGVNDLGRVDAHSISGRAEGGDRFRIAVADLLPYAALQVTSLTAPGYTETGAGPFALAYDPRTAADTRVELGLRLSKSFTSVGGAVTKISGRLAWAHAFSPQPAVTAGFVALPGTSFAAQGAARPSDTALVSLGVSHALSNGVTLGATADGEFGAGLTSVSGKARLSFTW